MKEHKKATCHYVWHQPILECMGIENLHLRPLSMFPLFSLSNISVLIRFLSHVFF